MVLDPRHRLLAAFVAGAFTVSGGVIVAHRLHGSTTTAAHAAGGVVAKAGSAAASVDTEAAAAGHTVADALACDVFPADNPWNTEVSELPVHERSSEWVASVGLDGTLHPDFGTEYEDGAIGLPVAVVGADQRRVPVSFEYADESDPGPYPIPPDVPREDGDDGHVIVVDDDDCVLYELYAADTSDGGRTWDAVSGAVFDLSSNDLRPDTWTSADAAGLAILPGLVRYDEVVERGEIDHALRFTAARTQRGSCTRPPTSPPTTPTRRSLRWGHGSGCGPITTARRTPTRSGSSAGPCSATGCSWPTTGATGS